MVEKALLVPSPAVGDTNSNEVAHLTLASAVLGSWLRIVAIELDDGDIAAWLAAVGLHEGEEVVVLRRAALGGPLHLRTSSGGEFAVARELALRLEVIVVRGAER
jgi:ferrous iron transport protein A